VPAASCFHAGDRRPPAYGLTPAIAWCVPSPALASPGPRKGHFPSVTPSWRLHRQHQSGPQRQPLHRACRAVRVHLVVRCRGMLTVHACMVGRRFGPSSLSRGLARDQQEDSRCGLRSVVGAQQLRGESPAVGGQPLLHGLWWGAGVGRGGGEVAGEDGSITAHRTPHTAHAMSTTGPWFWQWRQCCRGRSRPGRLGSVQSQVTARSARCVVASSRVVGSCPHHGQARGVRGADAGARVCPSRGCSVAGAEDVFGGLDGGALRSGGDHGDFAGV